MGHRLIGPGAVADHVEDVIAAVGVVGGWVVLLRPVR